MCRGDISIDLALTYDVILGAFGDWIAISMQCATGPNTRQATTHMVTSSEVIIISASHCWILSARVISSRKNVTFNLRSSAAQAENEFDTYDEGAAASKTKERKLLVEPLQYGGTLDSYRYFDVTPVIGREFPEAQLNKILKDDAQIRDLGITIAQRGVIFFRNQDLTVEQQKALGQKLGELTGKPSTSKLHRHAVIHSKRGVAVDEQGNRDDEISVISSEQNKKFYNGLFTVNSGKIASHGWHADISFENASSDYTLLKIITLPEEGTGGDTLWASGYEAYDRLSPAFKKLAESLKAVHSQPYFRTLVEKHGLELIEENRGSPENRGTEFWASHPVVRTNPVTGWKSLFASGSQIRSSGFEGVTERENEILKLYFLQLIAENHDLQVRFKWGLNDVAIWDNRSAFHTATYDYYGKRQGNRVVSVGEKAYFDPSSTSRREALFGQDGL
ncbi:alpha-ketoglutarate-dependent sulfonate dioxygenase [Hypoxylon trugodes]|uniref:alpha-ketoglutarate-dependent sulfonate dioxygenase n=1 Tax=Hypoxylon trugodes TaxID=326681 RepID=UPI002193B010|nr:alpha-ketoglutarate-dependent sulfonate dioxygenase [Hypoxylon trugodes]KAI1393088.1 alpha-ketoglutarate-dependent sulfonate dioxygenase [Hypoxylon trugodes]